MNFTELLIASGVIGIVLGFIFKILEKIFDRRTAKKDKEEKSINDRLSALETGMQNLMKGQMATLHDRIKFLAIRYIEQKFVYLDDLEDLKDMHEAYQANGGNGFLDDLMTEVDRLEKRIRK